MDTGSAQVISSLATAITSIVVTIIAGYYAVITAQIRASEHNSFLIQPAQSKKSWSTLILYAAIISILSVPIGFVFAYTGNSISGVLSEYFL